MLELVGGGSVLHFLSKCVENHGAKVPFSGQMCHFRANVSFLTGANVLRAPDT